MPKRLTTKQFIEKAKHVHGNKYDYSKTKYIKSNQKVIIICHKHGEFLQKPNSHISLKRGCSLCGGSKKLTTEEFIRKAEQIHGNKYDYSNVNYINAITKIIIICKKHGKFSQTPNNHLRGQGCPKCYYTRTTEEFIENANKVHNNKYDYSIAKFINSKRKLIIICPKHNEFKQSPNNHLSGQGCPKCSFNISIKETKWLNDIEKKYNIKIKRNSTIYINEKKIIPDGYHKETNTIYEYYGYFWHGHPNYYNSSDINWVNKKTFGELYRKTLEKEKLIKSAGYNLIVKWGK